MFCKKAKTTKTFNFLSLKLYSFATNDKISWKIMISFNMLMFSNMKTANYN